MADARLDPMYGSPMTVRRPTAAENLTDAAIKPFYINKEAVEKYQREIDRLQWEKEKAQLPVWTSLDKIKMRLGLEAASTLNYHCTVFHGPNITFIFVAKGDKALILEDDKNLFPSDSLIGQLSLWASTL